MDYHVMGTAKKVVFFKKWTILWWWKTIYK